MLRKTMLTLCVALTLSQTVLARNKTIVLKLNYPNIVTDGQAAPIDDNGTAPLLINGRTYVPVRAVTEATEGEVSWDAPTKTATLTKDGKELKLKVGSNTAYVDGNVAAIDAAPVIRNDRMLLPIRFISESFGYRVDWNKYSKTITITKA